MSRTSEPEFEDGTLNHYLISPDEIQGGDRFGYKVVAIVDEYSHTWRAYRGPTKWSDQEVADRGDAIPEKTAKLLFPSMEYTGRLYCA